MPLIQVCIPSYNYGHYLTDAIDSCLSQDVDFRLIVLDNASSDNTPELRERYACDSRVSWYRNDSLLPVQDNWNKAIALAQNGWVKLLQADDRLLPDSIKTFTDWTSNYPHISFIGHLSEIIDEEGVTIRRQMPYTKNTDPLLLSPKQGLPLKLRQIARLKEPTSNLFTKSAWLEAEGYRRDVRFTFDIALNVELMAKHSGVLMSSYQAQVRRHSLSDGATLPPQRCIDDLELLICRILQDCASAGDHRAAASWLQYKVIELAAGKFSREPLKALAFLYKNSKHISNLSACPITIASIFRRVTTGDVQRRFK